MQFAVGGFIRDREWLTNASCQNHSHYFLPLSENPYFELVDSLSGHSLTVMGSNITIVSYFLEVV